MQLPLFEIKDDDFYDVSKRLQMLWDIVEDERAMLRKVQRALFAKNSELAKMYMELKQENDELRQLVESKPKQASIYELFAGERAI